MVPLCGNQNSSGYFVTVEMKTTSHMGVQRRAGALDFGVIMMPRALLSLSSSVVKVVVRDYIIMPSKFPTVSKLRRQDSLSYCSSSLKSNPRILNRLLGTHLARFSQFFL